MLDKFFRGLFSMKAMAISMIIFAVAIAWATFIESDFGTPASKIAVYNAHWFEILLLHLSATLIVNIIHYKMYQREKWPTFIFHASFLLMIVGAALTRFIGFEGQMRVGVGESSNIIYSSTPYLSFKANDLENQYTRDEPRWLSEGVQNPFSFNFQLPNQEKVKVKYLSYQENMIDTLLVNQEDGKLALELFIRGESKYIFEGQQAMIGRENFSFERPNPSQPGFEVIAKEGMAYIQSAIPFQMVDMTTLSAADRMKATIDSNAITNIPADTLVPFYAGQLYQIGNESVVLRGLKQKAKLEKVKSPEKSGGSSILAIELSTANEKKVIEIDGSHNHIIQNEYFQFAGLNYEVGYGAIPIQIPFYLKCRDFILDKYPGSDMPSSYASEVTVIDEKNNVEFDQRIFMNHFMDYGGYRFFQSSYFPDGSGTVLSVNYDVPGTIVTYIAYFLMGLGMFLAIFNPNGRMRELNNLIRKSRANRMKMMKTFTLILLLGFFTNNHAQSENDSIVSVGDSVEQVEMDSTVVKDERIEEHAEHSHSHDEIKVKFLPEEVANLLDNLLVQDYDGRTIPYHTLSDKLLRKVYHNDVYKDAESGIVYNAVQTITAMHLYGPSGWSDVKLIFVSSKIRDQLGVEKHASVNELEDDHGHFKWMTEYELAYEKSDAQKNEFDKQLIKLGERYRIVKEVFRFSYFRVVPIVDDEGGKWVWPFATELKDKDQKGNAHAFNILNELFKISQGEESTDILVEHLEAFKKIQWEELRKFESQNPLLHKLTERHVEVEIAYNKVKIFDKIQRLYFIFGFILLILFFVRTLITPTLKREESIRRISIPIIILVVIVFLAHGIGLGMRWYITGHAPWSDGYEAIIFISWATILAGLMVVKKNPAVIAVTVLLSAMMLFVTELNLMDPEITPLEPVLQSYWLMIHVSIITSSYGFLGVSAILGFLNMVLYLLINKKNKKRLQMNIIELTSVSEMVMIIGLFLLSAGTFIGGIWANESWGRYWGWDPKEVWALVSMLVYATIIHLRWIPALSNRFLFNVLSLWGYCAILFTFFGVNFILVGLHSYAQGDGVAEWPTGVIVSIILFALFTAITVLKYLNDNKKSVKRLESQTE